MKPATFAPERRLGSTSSVRFSPDHFVPALKHVYKSKGVRLPNLKEESGRAYLVGLSHDLLKLLVDLLSGPRESLRILRHLKAGYSDTTTVGCF
jgi:hypothetical protein